MPAVSIYYSILQAVQSAVAGLTLTLGATVLPVSIRKVPPPGEDLNAVPCILVCPSEKPETVEDAAGEGYVYVSYGVEIVLVAAGNQDFTTNLDFYLNARQQIRQLFQGTSLAGVASVFDLEMVPETPIDRGAVSANYDYSALSVRVKSCELRGS